MSPTSTLLLAAACCASATLREIRRGFADPPQPLFRVNGQPAIGLAIAMRDGGDILALGKNIKTALSEATADLPIGIEPKLVADQAATVDIAISEFMTSLWQAVAIILAASFVSLGIRPGFVIALGHTPHACRGLFGHADVPHRHAAYLFGRAYHCTRVDGR